MEGQKHATVKTEAGGEWWLAWPPEHQRSGWLGNQPAVSTRLEEEATRLVGCCMLLQTRHHGSRVQRYELQRVQLQQKQEHGRRSKENEASRQPYLHSRWLLSMSSSAPKGVSTASMLKGSR